MFYNFNYRTIPYFIRTQYAAADDVVTAAQLVITNALDARLDAYDAIDFGTQAELDVEKARIDRYYRVATRARAVHAPRQQAKRARAPRDGAAREEHRG